MLHYLQFKTPEKGKEDEMFRVFDSLLSKSPNYQKHSVRFFEPFKPDKIRFLLSEQEVVLANTDYVVWNGVDSSLLTYSEFEFNELLERGYEFQEFKSNALKTNVRYYLKFDVPTDPRLDSRNSIQLSLLLGKAEEFLRMVPDYKENSVRFVREGENDIRMEFWWRGFNFLLLRGRVLLFDPSLDSSIQLGSYDEDVFFKTSRREDDIEFTADNIQIPNAYRTREDLEKKALDFKPEDWVKRVMGEDVGITFFTLDSKLPDFVHKLVRDSGLQVHYLGDRELFVWYDPQTLSSKFCVAKYGEKVNYSKGKGFWVDAPPQPVAQPVAHPNVRCERIPQHEPGAKLDDGKTKPRLVLGGMSKALEAVIEVGTYGEKKYTEDGWLFVPDAEKRYTDAMLRHYLAEQREDFDPESNLLHASHLAWNALARLHFILERIGSNYIPRKCVTDEA